MAADSSAMEVAAVHNGLSEYIIPFTLHYSSTLVAAK